MELFRQPRITVRQPDTREKNILRGQLPVGAYGGSSHPTTWVGAFAARTAQLTVRSYIHQLSTEMPGRLMTLFNRLHVVSRGSIHVRPSGTSESNIPRG